MEENKQSVQNSQSWAQGSSRAGIGVVCAIFLGLFGLLIMLCWPAGSYERRTFVKGWLWAFFIMLALEIIMACVVFFVFGGRFWAIII